MSASEELMRRFAEADQGHVFRFWDRLDASQRADLILQAEEIDLDEITVLAERLLIGRSAVDLRGIEPAPYVAHPAHGGDPAEWRDALNRGEAILRAGRVAAFTVAGGQGTRLGFDGPKGSFPVTPVRRLSLFGVFAEKILAARLRYSAAIPWFIMTGYQNHAATERFFSENDYFGLEPDSICFFQQGRMPAVDQRGKIILSDPGTIALSPDGHGGSFRALSRSGALHRMESAGIDTISYFQVDNPLVHCIDPAFIGFHHQSGAEFSSKMVPKANAGEKLGHFCRDSENRTTVIEYSDMPDALTTARDSDGALRFRAGSIAIHIIGISFARRIGDSDGTIELPFHRAEKRVPMVDDEGLTINPEKPNAIKFEMFVFDALPFARDPIVIETLREDEFSPVKNATGVDSPETALRDQIAQWTRWARSVGVEFPTNETDPSPCTWEVSPLFADTQDAFAAAWEAQSTKPKITDGTVLEGSN